MSTDNSTPSVESTETLSPEIADYFNVEQGTSGKTEVQNVKTETTDTNDTKEDTQEGKELPDESQKSDESEKDEKESEDPKEDDSNSSKVYKIGGQEFKTPEEAITRAAQVYGDNSRMAGEVKSLKSDLETIQEQISERDKELEELREANLKWQQYYEGLIDSVPENKIPEVDIEKKIEEKFRSIEQKKSLESRQQQFQGEIEEISKKPDFKTVEPMMIKILDQYFGGDSQKIGPKELFQMAKGFIQDESPSIQEAVEDLKRKSEAKEIAKKVIGGSSRKATVTQYDELPPELADYFKFNT